MRAVLQRVGDASVTVEGQTIASIGAGLVVLVAVRSGDGEAQVARLARKIIELRIFADQAGHFNRSIRESKGQVLVVSQFTLYADARKGRRPNFSEAAGREVAEPLIDLLAELLRQEGLVVATGRFGASMLVKLSNDGPVTIILDVD